MSIGLSSGHRDGWGVALDPRGIVMGHGAKGWWAAGRPEYDSLKGWSVEAEVRRVMVNFEF